MAAFVAAASGFAPLPAQEQPGAASDVFEALEGTWEGRGELLGRPAVFEMRWRSMGGFVHLDFANAWVGPDGDATPVLSARATYRVEGRTASGVWIDDRPQRLRLDATLTDSSIVTTWVADAEQGRTEYVVRSPEAVIVRDFVLAEGSERLFAEAEYTRGPAGRRD